MRAVNVTEVRIDGSNRLVVVPRLARGEDLGQIYRAAMGIAWDAESRALTSPSPEAWSHFDWFRHIVAAVAQEYGAKLALDADTTWSVPDELRRDIETWSRGGGT